MEFTKRTMEFLNYEGMYRQSGFRGDYFSNAIPTKEQGIPF